MAQSCETSPNLAPMDADDGWRGVRPRASAAVLVDYDNFFPGPLGSTYEIQTALSRMVDFALKHRPAVTDIAIRMYGGWLQDGVLTDRASELQTLIGSPASSAPHPNQPGLLRIEVGLVLRLAGLPGFMWEHTFRSKAGLPRLRLVESPRPSACMADDCCPIDLLQRISRKPERECHVAGCGVRADSAFLVREQKMVDTLIACDCLTLAEANTLVMVLSNDLDVLPAIALAASNPMYDSELVLVRSPADTEHLYGSQLAELNVVTLGWSAS